VSREPLIVAGNATTGGQRVIVLAHMGNATSVAAVAYGRIENPTEFACKGGPTIKYDLAKRLANVSCVLSGG
jgi:hypothetical protein